MAAAYEIKELGYIGSLWKGEFKFALDIGQTVEITNVLNTIETSKRQSVFFTTRENFDIDKLNRQISNSNFSFLLGTVRDRFLDDLALYTQIDKNFLSNQTALFRFNKFSPQKTPATSQVPIQDNWSFDTSNPSDAKIIFSSDAVIANYVFLVSATQQRKLVDYFSKLEQETLKTALPPEETTSQTSGRPILFPNIKIPDSLKDNPPRPPFNPPPANEEEEINRLAEEKFKKLLADAQTQQNIGTPTGDSPDFTVDSIIYTRNVLEINNNLRIVNLRINAVKEALAGSLAEYSEPLTIRTQLKSDIVYLELIRKYLLDSLGRIYGTQSPLDNPSIYENRDGFVSLKKDQKLPLEPYRPSEDLPTQSMGEPSFSTESSPADRDENTDTLRSLAEQTEPVKSEALPPIPSVDDILNSTTVQEQINEELDTFDELVDQIIEDLEIDDNNIYTFKKVSKLTDYSLPIVRYRTKGLFDYTGENISTFHTGSLTEKQKKYYLKIFNEPETALNSYHQFDISYCHISGSGSSHVEGEIDFYPAKSMYRKYMLECFGQTYGKFPFKNNKNGDYFYVIQLNRDQYKEKLDAGNFELTLCELSSSGTVIHPSSSKLFTLIDDSRDSKQEIVSTEGIGEYYYITSGSLRDGIYGEPEDDAWGIVFPKTGLIVLDGVILDQSCSFNTITGSTDGQNAKRLFLSISGAAVPTSYRPSGTFFARSFETFLTETYFCRADFDEFNHSSNYTYTSGSNKFIKYDYFHNDPHSYITSIGLYNKKRELLAIGKLRSPMLKNSGKVCIFEVVVRLN